MIFRRIRAHIEKENWFAVALDFFIVVAGILIAFQITNWNDARSDRIREGQYFEYLRSDIQEELGALEEVQSALRIGLSVTETMFADALGETMPRSMMMSASAKSSGANAEIPIPEPIDVSGIARENFLSFAVFNRIFNEDNSTFKTLQDTGDFGIISDKSLAQDIANYYANIEVVRNLEGVSVRDIRDQAAALALRNGLNSFGRNDYDSVLTALENDIEFAASLRALRNIRAINLIVVSNSVREASALHDKLSSDVD